MVKQSEVEGSATENGTGTEGSGQRHRYRIKIREKKKVKLRHRAAVPERIGKVISKKWKPVLTTTTLIILVLVTGYFIFEIFSDQSNSAALLRKMKVGK